MPALVDIWGVWEIEATLLYWALLPFVLLVAGIGWIIGKARARPAAAVAVVGVTVLALVAAGVGLAAYNNATTDDHASSSEDLYRTGDEVYDREEYDPAKVWASSTASERRTACTSFTGGGGYDGTVDMLIDAGYPRDDAQDTARFLSQECVRSNATTTTTVSPQRQAEARREIDEAVDALYALTDLEQLRLCQDVRDMGGADAWSTWLWEQGHADRSTAGAFGIAVIDLCNVPF